jgi:zinc D-Ala-D-Ala carboxypeptidase
LICTKDFHPDTDPKLLCTCGHPECHMPSVDQPTLNQVQLIRDDIKRPVVITSAGRCKYHPNEIGKQQPRDHTGLKAVDMRADSFKSAVKLMVLAGRHGATRVAYSPRLKFVHAAWTETSRTDVPTWEY